MNAESKTENAVYLHEFWIQMPVKVNADWLQLINACTKATQQHTLQHPLHMTIFHGYVKDPTSLWHLNQPQNMQSLHNAIKDCTAIIRQKRYSYEVSEHNHLNKIICLNDATRMYNFIEGRLGGDENMIAAKFYTAADIEQFKFHVSLGKFTDNENAKAAQVDISTYLPHLFVTTLEDHFHNCVIKLGNLFKLKRVGNSCVGHILSKKKAMIQSIRLKTGAKIKIMDEDTSKFRNILIGGEEIQVMRAENMIDAVVKAHCSTANTSADEDVDTIWVDKSKIGKLMGKKGKNIELIRSKSGATIRISSIPTEEGTRAIEITGTRENINKAISQIEDKVGEEHIKQRAKAGYYQFRL